ncbi:MAG: maltose alpha-D-glucosyltransferase [Chloroflexi bacterium]|nr:MAG: maltose alpha-D-glucosyltransferase [Chloroflexota bacterium]
MSWHTHAIFYELYLRAFADGNGDGHGDFIGLRDKLDYLEWLGVDCIWLLPMYPSPLKDDGYDIASYYGIHPDYGLLEDFKMTVDAIHERGIKIIADLVINHTSDQHPWFQESRRSKTSPMRDWYVWSPTDERYQDVRIIFVDTETSNWAYDETTGEYYWHRFYSSQPDLNFDNPKVREEVLRIMKFWLDLGIDGFRADAVPYLFEREGTNCENLPETHDYLKQMRRFIDTHYPNAILLAEANQWPRDVVDYFGDGDEFHLCFHFPVMPRLYMALAKADRTSVVDILADTPPIPKGTQWGTFLRNHDELTLEMVTEEERQFMWAYYSPDPKQRINLGIRRRLAPLMGGDRRKIELMHSMLFTLPGAPVLYYGDEIGMGDNIALFDRNGVRTPMQWSGAPNAGFSSAKDLYAPVIDDATFGYQRVNVAAQRNDPTSLLHTVRHMIMTRKALPVLADGDLDWLHDLPKHALCFWRTSGEQRVLALHNLADAPLEIALPDGAAFSDALDATATVDSSVTLSAYGYRWLQTRT